MLEINNLTKIYGGTKTAVENLSLRVEAGDIYGFIGHNGAGKTTTIKCIVGICDFDQGEIRVDGKDVKKDSLACKRVTAYIPDNPELYDYLTGIQYLNFVADIYQVPGKEREKRIRKEAGDFGMLKALGDLISSYSHGMKQKLAIISALIRKPRLLILDEPFVGLDPAAAHLLKGYLRELCRDGGAVFFSTHVLEVAEKLCDTIAIIKDGRLVRRGPTEEVVGDSSLEDVFLGMTEKGAEA